MGFISDICDGYLLPYVSPNLQAVLQYSIWDIDRVHTQHIEIHLVLLVCTGLDKAN